MRGNSSHWKPLIAGATTNVAALAGFYPSRSHILFPIFALPLVLTFGAAMYLWLGRDDAVCRQVGIVGGVFLAGVIAGGFANHRYYLPLIPLLILALARVFQVWPVALPRRSAGYALAVLVLAVYVAGFYRQATMPHGHPWSSVVSAIEQRAHPDDVVVFNAIWGQVPFDYYARQEGLHLHETGFPVSIYTWWDQQPFKAWGGPVLMRSDLDQTARQLSDRRTRTIWLVQYEPDYYDPRGAVLERLGSLGRVREIALPANPDDRDASSSALHLIEISMGSDQRLAGTDRAQKTAGARTAPQPTQRKPTATHVVFRPAAHGRP